jgi:hypothetical protein
MGARLAARGYLVAAGTFLVDVVRTYLLYVAVAIGGTGLLMLGTDSIGFLSYSDRPGWGWYGLHPSFRLEDALFIAGFAIFATYLSVLSIAIPAVMFVAVALRRFSVHPALIAVVLVPVVALLTLWLFVAAGWYVSLAPVFQLLAVGLSILFSVAVSMPNGVRIWRIRIRAF